MTCRVDEVRARPIAIAAVVFAAALFVPGRASACSCGSWSVPDADRCRTAKRVFAGTVAGYDWPDPSMLLVERPHEPVGVELAVDRVWVGAVPARVTTSTGFGGGDCGIAPLPGTRFVVCDDEADGAAPSFDFCAQPAFDEISPSFDGWAHATFVAADLDDSLGPPHAPIHSLASFPPRRGTANHTLAQVIPLLAMLAAALVGRLTRRTAAGTRLPWTMLGLGAFACCAGAFRVQLVAHVLGSPRLAVFGPVVFATLLGVAVGFVGQRTPGRFGGGGPALVAAAIAVLLAVWAGYRGVHVPIDLRGAVACSRQRAEAILGQLPDTELTRERVAAALIESPHACTDWGLARYQVQMSSGDACLGFPDGDGGRWWSCRGPDGFATYLGWDAP